MINCLFCKIIAGDIPAEKIFEDENTFVFLDIGPVSKGHMLVIPKNHAENLTEGSVEDACSLMATVHKIAPDVMRGLGATGYNIGMNHGKDAGQEVFHTHIHLMPRYEKDSRLFVKFQPSKEELHEVAKKIREVLS